MSRGDGEKEARRNIRYGDGAAAVGRPLAKISLPVSEPIAANFHFNLLQFVSPSHARLRFVSHSKK